MRVDFDSEYKKLNADQKEAVDHIEGPLLVIAGPGTGKTQLLSLRAANILKKTDALPENVLCLTFTESGALEMRSRLIKIIGQDAYKVTISTYHSFGSEIIRANREYFGNLNLRPINALKANSLISDIQKGLPFTSELKNPEYIKSLIELVSDAKQALLTPDDLLQVGRANLDFINEFSELTKPLTDSLSRASIKSVESFKKLIANSKSPIKLPGNVELLSSIWNQELEAAIDETLATKKATSLSKWKIKYLVRDDNNLFIPKGQKQNERLAEFSSLYAKYLSRLKTGNLYDYDDMILLSIEAMKKHDELRFNLQERYLYIMLDEYQDTNRAQAELIYLLTNNPVYEGKPNIMAVGDDDQAIYSFQGAKHSNMLDFVKGYESVKQVTLKSNYRSPQSLIDLSTSIARQISERLTNLLNTNKDFRTAKNTPAQINYLNFNSEIEEYVWLAKTLKTTAEKDVAIIAPEHKYLERASAYLLDQGIPISYDRRENVLDDPLIEQIVTILRLIKAINDHDNRVADSLAATVLNFEFLNVSTETIWNLSWTSHDNYKPWLKVMLDNTKTKDITLALLKLATNSLSYRYDFIIDQIIGLSDIVINDPKLKSTRMPFMDYYSNNLDELTITKLFQNLMTLKEQFLDFNLDNSRPLMINDLIDFIDQLKASNIRLTNDFSYGQNNTSIKLMTAHTAKGQEFSSVYLLSLVNEVWGPKTGNYSRLSLPPNLEYIRSGADDADDESLRLLYVALSRAKDKVSTLSYNLDSYGRATTPLKYLNEPSMSAKEKIKVDLIPLWQKEEKLPKIETNLKDLLKKRLENYSLSPTELNTFIDVRNAGPQNFYKSILLKYRAPLSPRVDYGSAIHDSLDWLQQTFITTNKLPTLKQLTDEFERMLLKRRLLSEDFNHLKEQGKKALSVYYKANKNTFSVNDLSEYNFKSEGLSIGPVRISGKIDKLVIDKPNKAITIIDYKTGRGYKSWLNQPKLHLYRNQLYFYKLLTEKSSRFKNYKINGASLDFVEPDLTTGSLYELPLVYDDEQEKRFVRLIEAVWEHINALNFPSVSQYKANTTGIATFENDLINGRI